MKNISSLVTMLFVIIFFSLTNVASAQVPVGQDQVQVLNDQTAQRMDPVETKEAWSWLKTMLRNQAPSVVEITSSKKNIMATFRSTEMLPKGSVITFRMTMPDRSELIIGGYRTTKDGFWYAEMMSGMFPDISPAGFVTFEALIVDSRNRSIYVSSACAPVRISTYLSGPLHGAKFLMDGTIEVRGQLNQASVATVDGQSYPIVLSYDPTNGLPIGRVIVPNFGAREALLTLCTDGVCSTRHLYID